MNTPSDTTSSIKRKPRAKKTTTSSSEPKNKGGRPIKPKPDEKLQKALILAADNKHEVAKVLAKHGKTPAPHNRNITDEQMVVILARIASGETMRGVCLDLGVSAALVRKRGRDHPDKWGRELEEAEIQMAHAMFERRLEIAFDETIDTARAKLITDILKDQAKVSHRGKYGDQVKVENDHKFTVVMPDDIKNVI